MEGRLMLFTSPLFVKKNELLIAKIQMQSFLQI